VAHNGSFADSLDLLEDFGPVDRAYVYSLAMTAKDERGRVVKYVVVASPREPGKTGRRYFSIDETRTLHYEVIHPVDASSPLLQ
jgi:hypothetical protein